MTAEMDWPDTNALVESFGVGNPANRNAALTVAATPTLERGQELDAGANTKRQTGWYCIFSMRRTRKPDSCR